MSRFSKEIQCRQTGRSLSRLLASLEAAGCNPRPAGPGIWFAHCPSCLRKGWLALVEIRQTDAGIVVACASAHEPPREMAA
jgi:hypothetical protein